MRPGLLRDEDRHAVPDPVLRGDRAGQSIGPDGELPHGEPGVASHDLLPHEAGVLLLRAEIRAAHLLGAAVPEADLKVPEQEPVDVDLLHVEESLRPLEDRGGEDLSRGDIHVRHAVLKARLLRGVGKRPEGDP